MKKRLVIIGNYPIEKKRFFFKPDNKLANWIDSSDYVVRMNLCSSFDQGTGTKTDCVGIVNVGIPAIEFAYKNRINPLVIQQAETILFSRPKARFVNESNAHFPEVCQQDMSSYIISFQELRGKKNEYISTPFFLELNKIVGTRYIPSTGVAVVKYFLENKEFMMFEKYLVGFSWEGWSGHNWEAEKEYAFKCQSEGKLKII